jgi:hypothetical protein
MSVLPMRGTIGASAAPGRFSWYWRLLPGARRLQVPIGGEQHVILQRGCCADCRRVVFFADSKPRKKLSGTCAIGRRLSRGIFSNM